MCAPENIQGEIRDKMLENRKKLGNDRQAHIQYLQGFLEDLRAYQKLNHCNTMQKNILDAIEQVEGSIALQSFDADKDKRYAVILGNEVKGVQQQVVDICDGSIEIPQFGTKHSLNVSVTAGMVSWEFACKLGWVKRG